MDGRHRDFLSLAYLPPAAAFALVAWLHRGAHPSTVPQPATAWLSALLGICGVLAIDHPANGEALAWAATCLLLAASGWPAVRAEALRMVRPLGGGQQQ
jgi:hypothetical protein